MTRLFLATALTTLALIASVASCGDGFDTEEATAECNLDQKRLPNCMDDEAFALCVSCHQECGDNCATLDTVCPTRFTCPRDGE